MLYKNNLLVNLYKYCSAHDEDFITESFLHLLYNLVHYEKEKFCEFISHLTNENIKLDLSELKECILTSQLSTEFGVPDIVIHTNKNLIYIEIKIDSDFSYSQLSRYRKKINNNNTNNWLITITKEPYPPLNYTDINLRWLHVHEGLSNLDCKSEVCNFLIYQFSQLLIYKGLSMKRVAWELIEGINSLNNLMDLISEASSQLNYYRTRSVGANWSGYYINRQEVFVGIFLDNPHLLTMTTYNNVADNVPTSPDKGYFPTNNWRYEIDMTSETIHFFARTRTSQLDYIKSFIDENLQYARQYIIKQ